MTPTDLEVSLRGGCLDDVLRVGFVEQGDALARFSAVCASVYLEISGKLFEFEAMESAGSMRIAHVYSVRHNFGLDDDLLPAVTSVREQVLRDPDATNELVALHLWKLTAKGEALYCEAAQFDLVNGQQVFLDPSYHFGIRLGGPEQKLIWLETWPGAADATEQVQLLATR